MPYQPTIALQALQVCLSCCNLIVTASDITGETLILEMHTCCTFFVFTKCVELSFTLCHTRRLRRGRLQDAHPLLPPPPPPPQEGLLKSRLWLSHNSLLSPDFETRLQTISPRQSIYAHLQGC